MIKVREDDISEDSDDSNSFKKSKRSGLISDTSRSRKKKVAAHKLDLQKPKKVRESTPARIYREFKNEANNTYKIGIC